MSIEENSKLGHIYIFDYAVGIKIDIQVKYIIIQPLSVCMEEWLQEPSVYPHARILSHLVGPTNPQVPQPLIQPTAYSTNLGYRKTIVSKINTSIKSLWKQYDAAIIQK